MEVNLLKDLQQLIELIIQMLTLKLKIYMFWHITMPLV